MSRRAEAFREAAALVAARGPEIYPADVFLPPSSEAYAEINALLKRERGHQLDGVAADVMRRAYAAVARFLSDMADDIDDEEPA